MAGGPGLIPGQVTKIPHAKKKGKNKYNLNDGVYGILFQQSTQAKTLWLTKNGHKLLHYPPLRLCSCNVTWSSHQELAWIHPLAVTCFGEEDITNHDTSRSLKGTHSQDFPLLLIFGSPASLLPSRMRGHRSRSEPNQLRNLPLDQQACRLIRRLTIYKWANHAEIRLEGPTNSWVK